MQGLSDCSHRRAAAASPEDTLENSQAASQSCWTGSSGLGPAISVLVLFPGGFCCLTEFENHWLGHANSYTKCSLECIMVQRLKTNRCIFVAHLKVQVGEQAARVGGLCAVIQGLRVMKVLPSLLCDFQGCLEVIPAEREEHGERAEGWVPGLGPEVGHVTCVRSNTS